MVRPLVMCGPSGVGKGTLINKLLEKYPTVFGKKVSHTTRLPRAGEINGVSYHFTSKKNFEFDTKQGAFLETAMVHGNYYATSKKAVEDVAAQGKICVLELDAQGVESIRATKLNPHFIFVFPPTFETLEQRLRKRGSETEDSIQTRLTTARKELKWMKECNFLHHKVVCINPEIGLSSLEDVLFNRCYPQFAKL
mmetsp:Transcript_22226/g.44108  ORF Transcript_22226/g.44108 Transcript_22226/m.44108 type:complete len:195 (+) Transcript_22226:105-689(+)